MVNDMVAYDKAREGRADLEARWRNGECVDLDGYPVTSALYNWLHKLTVEGLAKPLAQSVARASCSCFMGGRPCHEGFCKSLDWTEASENHAFLMKRGGESGA